MELIPVTKLSQWRKIYRLYKSAFPNYERKPFMLIRSTHRKGRSDVWVIQNDGEFAGLAITLNSKDMVLLDYFAISNEMRGNGLGGKALRILQAHYNGRRLFLEIESTFTKSDNTAERIRRKQFYLNNGMSELKILVNLFGTEMELLGYDCTLSFDEYKSVYTTNFGRLAQEKVTELEFPHK